MNDNDPVARQVHEPVRMIPLIGEIHDNGRFIRYDVVELLAVPIADLITGQRLARALADDVDGRAET